MSEKISAFRGLHKLEAIGKKGKLTKIIKVTIEQFEFLKQSLNEFSLKILAYVIKGFFLNIKKSYENFSKDLDAFIEINIKGVKPMKIKKEIKVEEKSKESENFFSIQNLSMFSDNTQFEKFLADTNMTDKINKTLKKINKKFSNVDFSSMTDDMKKDYLKKNFVQPLSESLPLSCDHFMNSDIDQCISINENFANYINFDLKSITQDHILKKQTQSQTQHSNNLEFNNEFSFSQREFDFELIDLKPNNIIKNSFFKVDSKIEYNIQRYCEEVEEIYSKEINFKNAVRIFLKNSKHSIYQKNYKKILLKDHLQKFKQSFIDMSKDINYQRILNDVCLIDDFSELSYESSFEGISMMKEKFRNESQHTPSKKSKTSKIMSELMTSTSIKNVFNDSYVSQGNQIVHDEIEFKMNQVEENFVNIENASSKKSKSEKSSVLASEQTQLINKELQENIESFLVSKRNFEEFKLDQIRKEITSKKSLLPNRLLSSRAECSLILYNMLIVSQTENFYLKQNAPFGKLYIIKI